MPTSLTKLALPMPNLPPCTSPRGRSSLLLQSLSLPVCPALPEPSLPELCGKISEIELEIEETVDDLELIVANTHAVELPHKENGINEDHTCVDRLILDIPSKLRFRLWEIDQSIFAPRKAISDGHGYNNTDTVWSTRFEKDWRRVTSTQRFGKLVGKELTEKDHSDTIVVAQLQKLCESEYPNVTAAFYYYSASDGDMSYDYTVSCPASTPLVSL